MLVFPAPAVVLTDFAVLFGSQFPANLTDEAPVLSWTQASRATERTIEARL